jgi:hypothetical protein
MARPGDRPTCLAGAEDDLVAFGVLEDGEGSPGLFPRRAGEFDAAVAQFRVRLFDVVDFPGSVYKCSNAILLAFGGEEHDSGFGAGDGELNPALRVGELLIGKNAESELAGVEPERAILVANGDAEELDAFDHRVQDASPGRGNQWRGSDWQQRLL